MEETKLAPGLLLSMPQLLDPNFTRAVVLMVEHNDHGSFGLIVNHPSEVETLPLLESMNIEWNGARDDVVWNGGPVMPSSGWILHDPIERSHLDDETTVALLPGISLTTSEKTLRSIAQDPPNHTRVLLGYSGWGPGQLAQEMSRGSWLHAEATPEIIFDTLAHEMWEKALRQTGISPEQIVPGVGIN